VTTPERVVIAEAQRTLAYLALYGYAADALLVNRVPPVEDAGADGRLSARRAQLDAIDATFSALPRLSARDRADEPLGLDVLADVGRELYGAREPLARLSPGQALEITSLGPESRVRLAVPGVERHQVRLERDGDELVVSLGAHRRSIVLPEGLRDRDVVRAGIDGHHLEIVFGERIGVG
jgi:arsenite/tail-anchored protein-transporting ATPase